MRTIKELVESKEPELERKIKAMGAYLGQHTHDFHVRENCLWMDDDSSSQFHSERRWSIESVVSTTGAQKCSMRRGTSGFPTSTGVWWRPQMGAKSAPKQVKALSYCAPRVTLERYMNLKSLMNAGN